MAVKRARETGMSEFPIEEFPIEGTLAESLQMQAERIAAFLRTQLQVPAGGLRPTRRLRMVTALPRPNLDTFDNPPSPSAVQPPPGPARLPQVSRVQAYAVGPVSQPNFNDDTE